MNGTIKAAIAFLPGLVFFCHFVLAQQNIVANGQTVVSKSDQSLNITGGQRKGANLYHNFQNFNLGKNDIANFLNNDPNAPLHSNIISRVTGGASNINGEIRTTGFASASLFFFNPKGIVFGPSAKLSIPGSFHASTGDYIEFADGEKYFADASSKSVSLTSASPADFGFIDPAGTNAARVQIQGSNLSVPDGQVIRIVGGEIRVIDASLIANKGQIELLGKKDSGIFSGVDTPGTVVKIVADDLSLSGQVSVQYVGSGVKSSLEPAIEIDVETLTLKKGAEISSTTTSGDINITAGKSIEIQGSRTLPLFGSLTFDLPSRINASTPIAGNVAGNIHLQTPKLSISNKGQVVATSAGLGDGGSGGKIDLAVNQLTVENRGKISSTASGNGKGGSITVGRTIDSTGKVTVSAERVTIDGEDSFVTSNATRKGNAGDILITADLVSIKNSGKITAATKGTGQGGNLTVTAITIELDNEGVISASSDTVRFPDSENPGLIGRSGEILLTATDAFRITNGGQITLSTKGANAGNVKLDVGETLLLSGNGNITTSVTNKGNGGNINIDPVFVILLDGSKILAQADEGRGGAIDITTNFCFGCTREVISASAGATGTDGTVDINSPETNVLTGLLQLSESFNDASLLLSNPCAKLAGSKTSRFVATGRQGLPQSPDGVLVANSFKASSKFSREKKDKHAAVLPEQSLAEISSDCVY